MNILKSVVTVLSLALVLSVGAGAFQADKPADKEATLTGCLSKGASAGQYVLAAEGQSDQVMITGGADLDKHAANHTVKVTGTWDESAGQKQFRVSKIEHVADSCKSPSAQR